MKPIPQNSPRMLALAVCVTLLVLELYFFACLATPRGMASPPQGDTLVYMQYAREIAEGHPYHYLPGAPLSTGSTSHLYPFVLAIPYVLGAHGEALYIVSMFFNVAFLLLTVALVWFIARRLTPETTGYAVMLTALSGPLSYPILQQSDIGLFTVLALCYFAAMLYDRHRLASLFLTLVVWCRPDGCVVAAATLGYGVLAHWNPQRRRILALGLWGLVNVLAMLLLNYALTGSSLFQSMAGKGYLVQYSFAGAVMHIVMDFCSLFTGFLLGLQPGTRQYYTLPLIGGLLALAGLLGRLMRTDDRATAIDGCWALVTLGVFVMTAAGGWAGFNYDRHIAWLFPFFALYMAAGIQLVKQALPRRPAWHLVGITVVSYQTMMLPYFVIEYAKLLQITHDDMEVASRAHRLLPPQKSIMVTAFGAATYLMPGRNVISVGGFTTPQLAAWSDSATNVEILRRHPELRGDYWLTGRNMTTDVPLCAPFLGREIMGSKSCFPAASAFYGVYEADWSSLLASRTPLTTNVIAVLRDWRLVDELDVGYVTDEKSHGYQTFMREPNVRLGVFIVTANIGDRKVTEAARLVMGYDTFRIHATPGCDLRMVMRTSANLLDKTAKWYELSSDISRLRIGPDLHLQVDVDGVDAGVFNVSTGTNKNDWSEVIIDVLGDFVHRPDPRITISGDHVAAYYWFYQR